MVGLAAPDAYRPRTTQSPAREVRAARHRRREHFFALNSSAPTLEVDLEAVAFDALLHLAPAAAQELVVRLAPPVDAVGGDWIDIARVSGPESPAVELEATTLRLLGDRAVIEIFPATAAPRAVRTHQAGHTFSRLSIQLEGSGEANGLIAWWPLSEAPSPESMRADSPVRAETRLVTE
jgi:hypothetical protein